jgi:hypothetical protein
MPRSALRSNLYPRLKLVPTLLASVSAITTASLKADPKTTTAQLGPAIGTALYIYQSNSWLILLFSACAIILLNIVLRWIGEPWRWNAIQVVLDRLRDNVYKQEFPSDPYHYHRVTLFKHVPVSVGLRIWPWSGWLVPMARSGHTNQNVLSVFKAPDDGDNAQGVAGLAWTTKQIVYISELPEINDASSDHLLEEYAKATNVSVSFLRRRILKSRSNPRSLIAIPIEVNNQVKWIVVLDSRNPKDLREIANTAASSYTPIISHLLKGA